MILIGILEDNHARVGRFGEALHAADINATVIDHDNAPSFLQWLEDETRPITLVSLDHDLVESDRFEDRGTGMDVVRALCGRKASFPVIVHTSGPEHRREMTAALTAAGWTSAVLDPAGAAGLAAWAKLVRRLATT